MALTKEERRLRIKRRIRKIVSGTAERPRMSVYRSNAQISVPEKAKAAGIEAVVFDRNGYLYHGRVKALADAARNGGLNF